MTTCLVQSLLVDLDLNNPKLVILHSINKKQMLWMKLSCSLPQNIFVTGLMVHAIIDHRSCHFVVKYVCVKKIVNQNPVNKNTYYLPAAASLYLKDANDPRIIYVVQT